MENKKDSSQKYMVIEHMEEYLYEWCKDEYIQVMKYLKNSKMFTPVLSNFKQIQHFDNGNEEDKIDNEKNLNEFSERNNQQENKFLIVNGEINDEKHFQEEDKLTFQTQDNQQLQFENKRVCLLDLRGSEILSPQDFDQFDCFIFGGILGDHPPRDRTKQLRNPKFTFRHLESLQLSTDTAVLVTKLIIENQRVFQSLPFVDEPSVTAKNSEGQNDIQFQLEGFRYLQDVYDEHTADILPNKHTQDFLMSNNIKHQMLTKDLDFNLM